MRRLAKKWVVMSLGAIVLAVASGAAVAAVAAGSVERGDLVLKPRFHRVLVGEWHHGQCSHADQSWFASGRFVLFGCGPGLLLVDDTAGKRVAIRKLGSCASDAPIAFGAPWILFRCIPGEKVYNVVTHVWKRVGCLESPCAGPTGTVLQRESIGARWLERDEQWPGPCGSDYHTTCGPIVPVFVNLRTGTVRHGSPPQSSTTILDLSSPTLVRHLCAPLSVPAQTQVAMHGRVAIFSGPTGTYVQSCGSLKRARIPAFYSIANQHALVWAVPELIQKWRGRIGGLLLPSLRPFTSKIPSTVISGAYWILGSKDMYTLDPRGTFWAAPFPS